MTRREKKAESANGLATPVPVKLWGKDHWATFAYAVSRVAGNEGLPEKRQMRCDKTRHPAFVHLDTGEVAVTRLRGDSALNDHDDWDCIDDAVAFGLLRTEGTGITPVWRLTEKGWRVAKILTEFKQDGGNFADFALPQEELE